MPQTTNAQAAISPERLLGRVARRVRRIAFWDSVLLFVPPTAAIGYLLLALDELAILNRDIVIIAGIAAIILGVVLFIRRYRPLVPDVRQAAQWVDQRVEAKDRFLTLSTLDPQQQPSSFMVRLQAEAESFGRRVRLKEDFPYTIRIVSDIMESNGSSSMASVCGGSLAMMDGGVPTKAAVAGVAMGLIKEEEKVIILTDILGDEDHFGDMDFKVTGTSEGITGYQMDIKISGINLDIMAQALEKAKAARLHILDKMNATIAKSRSELSAYAPRIITLKIKVEKIGEVIGPGGKTIRSIVEATGAKIDIDDDGTVLIASVDGEAGEKARQMVEAIVEEPEINKVYTGTVRRITNFGAFVEILPGTDGLLHISEIDHSHVQRVEDFLKLGDKVDVQVIAIDPEGKIRLSRKALLKKSGSYGAKK